MNYYLRHPFLRVTFLAVVSDLACLGLAAAAVWWLLAPPVSIVAMTAAVVALGLLGFGLMATLDGYLPQTLSDVRASRGAVLKTAAATAAALGLASLAAPAKLTLIAGVGAVAAGYLGLVLALRPAYRALILRPGLKKRAVVLGNSELGLAVADAIVGRKDVGIELVGLLVGDLDDLPREISGHPVLGRMHQLEKLIDSAGIDIVVVASQRRDEQFPADQLLHAKLQGVHVESGISFYERVTGRVYLRGLRPSYLVFSEGFHKGRVAEAITRCLDVGFSAFGLLIAAPLLVLAAAAIKLDSPGPLFYRQDRMGRGGRSFQVLKFRTMRVDAEKDGPAFTAERDSRVTRVGQILRMTRIDEVPQYWNVIRGDMALVGPRPERPEFMEMLNARYPFFALRTACKPGLTGWAQVRHGYVNRIEGFEDKLGLDLYYLKHRSPLMDLVIVFQTVKTVLFFRGI